MHCTLADRFLSGFARDGRVADVVRRPLIDKAGPAIVGAYREHRGMDEVFIGSAALARGLFTRGRSRWHYRAIFPDVYVPKLVAPTLGRKTFGAWLWSGRNGVITGRGRRGDAWCAVGKTRQRPSK
jgi:hypothetical protein